MAPLKIKAFGAVAESLAAAEFEYPLYADTETLLHSLCEAYPALRALQFSLAVNQQIVQESTPLEGGEEVALLPPFSGG